MAAPFFFIVMYTVQLHKEDLGNFVYVGLSGLLSRAIVPTAYC